MALVLLPNQDIVHFGRCRMCKRTGRTAISLLENPLTVLIGSLEHVHLLGVFAEPNQIVGRTLELFLVHIALLHALAPVNGLSGNMIFCHAPGTCAVLMFIFVSHTADLCIIRTFNTQIQIMALSAPVINSSMFCNIHIITLLSICTVANPLMALTFLTDTNTLYLKKANWNFNVIINLQINII